MTSFDAFETFRNEKSSKTIKEALERETASEWSKNWQACTYNPQGSFYLRREKNKGQDI